MTSSPIFVQRSWDVPKRTPKDRHSTKVSLREVKYVSNISSPRTLSRPSNCERHYHFYNNYFINEQWIMLLVITWRDTIRFKLQYMDDLTICRANVYSRIMLLIWWLFFLFIKVVVITIITCLKCQVSHNRSI